MAFLPIVVQNLSDNQACWPRRALSFLDKLVRVCSYTHRLDETGISFQEKQGCFRGWRDKGRASVRETPTAGGWTEAKPRDEEKAAVQHHPYRALESAFATSRTQLACAAPGAITLNSQEER
jgi:hypothetical protein